MALLCKDSLTSGFNSLFYFILFYFYFFTFIFIFIFIFILFYTWINVLEIESEWQETGA